jgi:hypothetical protein
MAAPDFDLQRGRKEKGDWAISTKQQAGISVPVFIPLQSPENVITHHHVA